MAVSLTSGGVLWNDSSLQPANANAVDTGKLLSIVSYTTSGTWHWTPAVPAFRTYYAATWNGIGSGYSSGLSWNATQGATSTSTWVNAVYSTETVTYMEAKPGQTNCYMMFGLTTTPGASYANIEYALYYVADGTIQIYESGTYIGSYGTYNTSFVGRVTYDGSYIRYYCDPQGNRPLRSVAVSGKTLKAQSAFYNGGTLTSVNAGSVQMAYATSAYVKIVGGGGGGAGYMESGGAGGYVEGFVNVQDQPAGMSVVVGAGGAATAYYAAGGTGGTSHFSSMYALGGTGANSILSHTGGKGGAGYGGALNVHGGCGTGHGSGHSSGPGGKGGTSYFGSNSHKRHSDNSAVGYGSAPGAGGPGAISDSAGAGVAGAAGGVVIYAYQ